MIPDLRDPMSWSIADRCFVLACLFVAVSAPFIVGVTLAESDAAMAQAVDLRAGAFVRLLTLGVDGAWVLIALVSLLLRRRVPKSRALEHATIQLIAVSLAVMGYFMGLATTPFALALLGALVTGLLLFRRAAVLWGTATCAAITIGSAVATSARLLPYGPLFREIPASHGRVALFFQIEMMLLIVVTIGLVLGIFLFVLGRLRDREANLERLSRTDPLTGLSNRRAFFAALERELARASRRGEPTAVAIIDLDHFKAINDRHGHLTGDAVLVAAAQIVHEGLRREDVLARYGGEEFVALLPGTDLEGARAVAERCRARLQEVPVLSGGASIEVTASFGIAARPAGASCLREADLLKAADDALYRAKREGRNRVEVAA